MSKRIDQTVRIKVQWLGWNYGHGEDGPYWLPDGEQVYDARVTDRSFIVHYGEGHVRKLLRRFGRHTHQPLNKWTEAYGSHDRLSRTKLIFTVA